MCSISGLHSLLLLLLGDGEEEGLLGFLFFIFSLGDFLFYFYF
jgi:hypothetical protein